MDLQHQTGIEAASRLSAENARLCAECRRSLEGCPEQWTNSGVCSARCRDDVRMEG